MAKTQKGIMGPFSGKVGPVVGSTWKGISYIKAAPVVTGKKRIFSAAQLANQAKFKFMNSWLEPFHPFVTIGFAHCAHASTEINTAFKINYQEALQGNFPNFYMQYDKVSLSRGTLAGLNDLTFQLISNQTLQLNWEIIAAKGAHNDQLMLVVYSDALNLADGCVGFAKRNDGLLHFTFNAKLIGQYLEVYLTMASLNRKKVSDSQYLGRITPL